MLKLLTAFEYYIQRMKFYCVFSQTLSQKQHWIFVFFVLLDENNIHSGPFSVILMHSAYEAFSASLWPKMCWCAIKKLLSNPHSPRLDPPNIYEF